MAINPIVYTDNIVRSFLKYQYVPQAPKAARYV